MKRNSIIASAVALVAVAVGTKLVLATKRQRNLIEYLKQNGFSLQCVGGRWAVTDASGKVVGTPEETPEKAIDSAVWVQMTLAEVQS